MSVRIGRQFIPVLVAGLVGILIYVGGCESLRKSEAETEGDVYRQVSELETKRQDLEEKIQQQKDEIRALAEEHGAGHLDSRLELQLKRVETVTEELVRIEAARTKLEVEVDVLNSLPSKSADQEERLEETRIELKMARTYESRMRDVLVKEDAEAVELGRRKLAVNDLKEQLAANQQELETVTRRIGELTSQESKARKKWLW